MHPQLELLMEMQDMRAQSRALAEESTQRVEREVFSLTPDEARVALDAKIGEIAEQLEGDVRSRYDAIEGSLERVVVPVLNGVCYGCFVAAPTAWTSRTGRNDEITTCSHCGRFLYYVD